MKRIQNGQPIKSLARGAAGLFGGALFGTAGLALGIASGDPSKAFQYTSAGALGGYKGGKTVSDNVMDTFSVDEETLKKEGQMSWYGEEYKDFKYQEAIDEDLMSEQNIDHIRSVTGWSRDEAKEFLDDTGRDCYAQGVRDVEDMLAIKEVVDNPDPSKRIPMDKAIAATKLKNNLPQKIKNMSKEKLDKYEATYKEKFEKKLKELHPDWDDTAIKNEAEGKAKETIRFMQDLDKAKSSLTEV